MRYRIKNCFKRHFFFFFFFRTFPQHFKDHGFRTFSVSKIFHTNGVIRDPESWTEEPFEGEDYYYK